MLSVLALAPLPRWPQFVYILFLILWQMAANGMLDCLIVMGWYFRVISIFPGVLTLTRQWTDFVRRLVAVVRQPTTPPDPPAATEGMVD